jgi:asparagine synthase (glutamine-hydrolysing)
MLLLDQRFFLADHNLIYTDKMSMQTGVEVRVPLLSEELYRLSWRMSPRLKQRGSVGKWILKQAMRQDLPPAVINRSKSGFGAPARRWVRHNLRELIGDTLSAQALRSRGIFSPDRVQNLIERTQRGSFDGSYTILGILCIELWCRQFSDRSWRSL